MKESMKVRPRGPLHKIREFLRTKKMFADFNQPSLFHPESLLDANAAVAEGIVNSPVEDKKLIKRIITAYQRANQADLGKSMWTVFFTKYHQPIHQALIDGDERTVTEILRNPEISDLFYGFDILTKSFHSVFRKKRARNVYAKDCLDGLVRFAEAVGAVSMDNPASEFKKRIFWKTEDVLAELDKACTPFSMPNPFTNEHGVGSSRGVISYRVPQALYQAWRIKQLLDGIQNPRVLEIGAGLGRTSFYANELGIKDYTIVDLPITTVAQAYFLGRTLGEENICLDGEQFADAQNRAKIVLPETFLAESKTYDLVLNVDSLTEMDFSVAQAYWDKIKISTNTFLSINHEAHKFRVRDLLFEDLHSLVVHRGLYWMREGYAEELIRIPSA
jgi:SAM-dependent methyltransferase